MTIIMITLIMMIIKSDNDAALDLDTEESRSQPTTEPGEQQSLYQGPTSAYFTKFT